MEFYQTGDVLYIKTETLPEGCVSVAGDIFHQGENHCHRVRGDFEMLSKEPEMYLVCKSECELYHDEHHTIKAEPGIYKKRIVLEYDHLLEESRQVID